MDTTSCATCRPAPDRRAFLRAMAAAGLGLSGCLSDDGPTAIPVEPPGPEEPTDPPGQPPTYATDLERAFGVADMLVHTAERDASGARWRVSGDAPYVTDLYTGHAGVLSFLARAHRIDPRPELDAVLRDGARWLLGRAGLSSTALYEGTGGWAWAFLDLHEAFGGGGGSPWLEAALSRAPSVAATRDGLAGDLINGLAGEGLLLLRLYRATGDATWLDAARLKGDRILGERVSAEGGHKFPSFRLGDGRTVFYTGMAHGSAGAGYFLCRLAEELPASERDAYVDGARGAAAWLEAIARPRGGGLNWYRREPDQLDQEQIQWCHGAPGIGIFHAQLHRVTGEAAYLDTAHAAARLVEREGGGHWSCSQCHGMAGNAELFVKLFRETGDALWLDKARAFGRAVWGRRIQGRYFPVWVAGDGSGVDNPGLMTGTAGIGWFWLQLALDGEIGGPITD